MPHQTRAPRAGLSTLTRDFRILAVRRGLGEGRTAYGNMGSDMTILDSAQPTTDEHARPAPAWRQPLLGGAAGAESAARGVDDRRRRRVAALRATVDWARSLAPGPPCGCCWRCSRRSRRAVVRLDAIARFGRVGVARALVGAAVPAGNPHPMDVCRVAGRLYRRHLGCGRPRVAGPATPRLVVVAAAGPRCASFGAGLGRTPDRALGADRTGGCRLIRRPFGPAIRTAR